MEDSKLRVAARSSGCRKAQSTLVRRLVQSRDDPGKQRIRRWLSDINNEQLSKFGLNSEDVALLRGTPQRFIVHETPIRPFLTHQRKEGVRNQRVIVQAVTEAQLLLAGSAQPGGHDSETIVDKLIAILNRAEVVNAIRRMSG